MSVVRLSAVTIQGFQSYRNPCTVELDPHLTLLAGQNNVGKSAFLRAMQVFVGRQEGATNEFRLRFQWITSVAELESLGLPEDALGADDGSSLLLVTEHESLSPGFVGSDGGPQPLLTRIELSGISAATRLGNDWAWNDPDSAPFHVQYLTQIAPATGPAVKFIAPRRIQQGQRSLRPSGIQLAPDAANLTEVVFTLRANHSQTLFAEVQRAMRRCFPDLAELTVSIDEKEMSGVSGEVAVIYRSDRSRRVPLRLCGTGVEQMLALVVGIVTAREPCVFLIDEPQAFLHPHAERMLLDTIDRYRDHQYVVATHSNFLLGARPIAQSRLLSISRGATHVAAPTDPDSVVSNLGLTAADLWLPDVVLWGEGSSEVAVLSLLKDELPGEARNAIRIREMPAPASAFSGSPSRQGRALFAFCDQVMNAAASKAPRMTFVFDLDEKTPEDRAALFRASRDRAVFLSVRELENLFLSADVLVPVLNHVLLAAERDPVSAGAVRAELRSVLRTKSDKKLYPGGKDYADVRGSEVLRRLWWEFAAAPYEKPLYADALCRSALSVSPEILDPIRQILKQAIT
jgi:energy-coupling factor transporter ATP-binding protein EcfA2